jgi:arsenate reductase
MAEGFLRNIAGDQYEAYSAGLDPKGINPLTKKVMSEVGIDISQQYSKSLQDYMGKIHFSYLITVCSDADERCPRTFPGMGERLHWDIEDPAKFEGTEEQKLNKFREIRDIVKQKVHEWVKNQSRQDR